MHSTDCASLYCESNMLTRTSHEEDHKLGASLDAFPALFLLILQSIVPSHQWGELIL